MAQFRRSLDEEVLPDYAAEAGHGERALKFVRDIHIQGDYVPNTQEKAILKIPATPAVAGKIEWPREVKTLRFNEWPGREENLLTSIAVAQAEGGDTDGALGTRP